MVSSKMSTKTHQFSSIAQSCPTLCDPMNRSTPGHPVHHQLPEFTQTHVHQVSDAIQPSHPPLSPSPPAPNPSQSLVYCKIHFDIPKELQVGILSISNLKLQSCTLGSIYVLGSLPAFKGQKQSRISVTST